jgi:hypothetical protein
VFVWTHRRFYILLFPFIVIPSPLRGSRAKTIMGEEPFESMSFRTPAGVRNP